MYNKEETANMIIDFIIDACFIWAIYFILKTIFKGQSDLFDYMSAKEFLLYWCLIRLVRRIWNMK